MEVRESSVWSYTRSQAISKNFGRGVDSGKKRSLLKQHLDCHSIFIVKFFMIFIEVEGKMKSRADIFSFCVLTLGMDIEGTVGRLQGCFISPYLHALQAHSEGKMKLKRPVNRKIGAKCGGFTRLLQGSASLGESQCTAWIPEIGDQPWLFSLLTNVPLKTEWHH